MKDQAMMVWFHCDNFLAVLDNLGITSMSLVETDHLVKLMYKFFKEEEDESI